MEYPYLPKAPIREAIIDIRVKHAPNFDVTNFRKFRNEFSEDFPVMEDRKAFSAKINFGPKKADIQKEDDEIDAIIFRSEERGEVLQFSKEGFTFNKLKPYTNWDDVISKAKKKWEYYIQASKPIAITRIATRYINHILIPISSNIEDYLENTPKLPSNGPEVFDGALSRIRLIDPDHDAFVNLTQTIESKGKKAAIILDIDAFKKQQYEIEDDSCWEDFEELRELKNKIFFSSLKPKAINKFK
ncbi:MAG: TIGR04255 family protein [Balneolaceae bacterium]